MSGIKLLIVGTENSGKTTLISNIKDALVVSTDNKAFKGKVPHYRYSHYNGLDDFINTLEFKVEAYQNKFGSIPKTIVIDSITHLNNSMEKFMNDKYTGFNVWSNLGKDIINLNSYFEDVLITNGINVVLTAHTIFDADTGRFIIPASGSFGKNGSWLSVTDESRFIEVRNGKRTIHYKTIKYPCRSLVEDYPESVDISKYDINEDIAVLEKLAQESDEWTL